MVGHINQQKGLTNPSKLFECKNRFRMTQLIYNKKTITFCYITATLTIKKNTNQCDN